MPVDLQFITQKNVNDGWHLCNTCNRGLHRYDATAEPGRRWGRCQHCGARALNNAQIEDVLRIIQNHGQALVGACLGSRKTGTAVALMNHYRGLWIVVAPKFVTEQWVDAVREWAPDANVHLMNAKNKTWLVDLERAAADRNPPHDRFEVHVIGWELFRSKSFSKLKNLEGAIADEAHRMAGLGSASAKAMHKVNSARRLTLSGTPGNNKLWGLFNSLHWIWWGNNDHRTKVRLRRFKAMWSTKEEGPYGGWISRHFVVEEQYGPGGEVIEGVKKIGQERVFHSVVDEIPLYIQHLEDETCCRWHPGGVNASLPPRDEPKFVYVDMTPTQRKIYEKVDTGSTLVWLEALLNGRDAMLIDNDFVEKLRLMQIALAVPSFGEMVPDGKGGVVPEILFADNAASPSADALEDLLVDIVEEGDPVLVFTHSKKFATYLGKRVSKKFRTAMWTGEVKQQERMAIRSTFGTPEGPEVVIAVIAAIAEGVDGLQENCRREVWMSEERNNMLNTQGRGRLRRTGQRRRTQSWYIQPRGTIIELLYHALRQDKKALDAALRANHYSH